MPHFPSIPVSPQPDPGHAGDDDPFGQAGFVEPRPLSGPSGFAWPQPTVTTRPASAPTVSVPEPPAAPVVEAPLVSPFPPATPTASVTVGRWISRFRTIVALNERKKTWLIRLSVTAGLLLVGFALYQADVLSVSMDQAETGKLADNLPESDKFAPELSQAGPLVLSPIASAASPRDAHSLNSLFNQSEPPTRTVPAALPPNPGELTITPGPARTKPVSSPLQAKTTQRPMIGFDAGQPNDIQQISSELSTASGTGPEIQQPFYQQNAPAAQTPPTPEKRPEYPIYSGNRPPADSTPPSAALRLEQEMEKIDQLLQQGDTVNAHRLASRLYWTQPAQRESLEEIINLTSLKIYFLPQPLFIAPRTVRPGDNLEAIAREYRVTWQYLARLNRISDPQAIQPGQQLKVNRGPFAAVVDLSRHELTIHANNYYVRRFRIGVGREHGTPLGEFVIGYKKAGMSYTDPRTGEVIAGADPRNPLGSHFLQLHQNGQATNFGIHGASEPESIGQDVTAGCIRLNNKDIAVIFDLLEMGSPVIVRP